MFVIINVAVFIIANDAILSVAAQQNYTLR